MNPANVIHTIAPEKYDQDFLAIGAQLRPDEVNLAGLELPSLQGLSRREFLRRTAAFGAGLALLPTRGANPISSINPLNLSGIEQDSALESGATISGQFTPYGRKIMGVNLFTRFCFQSFYSVSEDPSAMAHLLESLEGSSSDEQFMNLLQNYSKYNFVQRPDVFMAISNIIRSQEIPSARNAGSTVCARDLIASVLEGDSQKPVERMVAPQVLRFGSRNKLDYIFRRVDILPKERWEIGSDGKPAMKIISPEEETRYPAIIVDCLAGNNMGFYADLFHGVEKEIGGYSWNPQKGGFYINNGGETEHRINRIPLSSLSFSTGSLED